jgi:RPA family protein
LLIDLIIRHDCVSDVEKETLSQHYLTVLREHVSHIQKITIAYVYE